MILDFAFVHSVTVKPYRGPGAYGPIYSDPVPVACWIKDITVLVRDSSGSEVTSTTTLIAPLEAAELFPPGSLVTLHDADRATDVISTARADSGPLGVDLDHIRVHLT